MIHLFILLVNVVNLLNILLICFNLLTNECILFNTDIFHDFDNSQSSSTRVILTLRIDETIRKKMYFDDVKNILFMNKGRPTQLAMGSVLKTAER